MCRTFVNVSSLFLIYLPLENDPSFEQTWILFVPSLVEIDPVVLEKKMEMWKIYDNNNDIDDNDDRQRTNFDQES